MFNEVGTKLDLLPRRMRKKESDLKKHLEETAWSEDQ